MAMHMERVLGEHLVSSACAAVCARFLCTSPSAHALMQCFKICLDRKDMNNFKHPLPCASFKVIKGHTAKQVYNTGGAETFSANADNLQN